MTKLSGTATVVRVGGTSCKFCPFNLIYTVCRCRSRAPPERLKLPTLLVFVAESQSVLYVAVAEAAECPHTRKAWLNPPSPTERPCWSRQGRIDIDFVWVLWWNLDFLCLFVLSRENRCLLLQRLLLLSPTDSFAGEEHLEPSTRRY